jgi:adenylate cyclase
MTDIVVDKPISETALRGREPLEASNEILTEALAADKREGLGLAVKARWSALAVIALLLPYLNQTWSVLYYESLLTGFALIGWAQLKIGRVGRSRAELFLILCDLVLLTFTLVVPNPLVDFSWPPAMQYRFDNFIYFFVLLSGGTLAFSWRTTLTMGLWTTVLWMAAMTWVIFQPLTHPELSAAVKAALAGHPHLYDFLDPNDVLIPNRIQEVVVFLIVAGTLALGGWRTNRLLVRQAAAARERANLARYFPPNIVDRLADRDRPLGAVRSQSVAVMFADIVGFTHIAERQSPDEVVATLREFHARMERAVFDNQGTLDKFLGDGLMATFGTPDSGPHDAENALRCARAMVKTVDDWNEARARVGAEPISLSIGAHYGKAVLGDIGSERRLEFAVLGDVVNVASRLEALTRELGVQVIVSDDLMQTAHAQATPGAEALLSDFRRGEPQSLRGRDEPILVWAPGGGTG